MVDEQYNGGAGTDSASAWLEIERARKALATAFAWWETVVGEGSRLSSGAEPGSAEVVVRRYSR